MNPDYEKYRPERGQETVQFNARVPEVLKKQVELLAAIEGDTMSALVIEGLARLVEDRSANSNFIESRRLALLDELATLDTLLPPQPS